MIKRYGWVVGCVFLGCASTSATPTGAPQTPRAPDCDFDVLTAVPATGYKEIGTVDVTPGGAFSRGTTLDLAEFKKQISAKVCQLGGDAAIAAANGLGEYLKATVLKRVAADAAPAAQASADGVGAHGCEYDSQCKGDRICVAGHCEAPAPPAAASVAAAPSASAAQVAPSAKGAGPQK